MSEPANERLRLPRRAAPRLAKLVLLVVAAVNGVALIVLGLIDAAAYEDRSISRLAGLWLLISGVLLAGLAIHACRRTRGLSERQATASERGI